jgi:hypothetical protein
MQLCVTCKDTFRILIDRWHAGAVSPAAVIAQVRQLGYSRLDAARFLFQLASDSARLRFGLLSPRDL